MGISQKIPRTLLLLFTLVGTALTSLALNFQVGGIYYSTSGNNVSVTSGTEKYTGDVVIHPTVTYNDKTYDVTAIGSYAFWRCPDLTSVTIPNSVTDIGDVAFHDCSSLTSITIPESVTSIGISAFSGCSGLSSATIGKSVTIIGDGAFQDCSSLTSITIPESVTSIGNSAFSGCSGLNSVTIGKSVTNIGNYAFSGCSSLTSITIPDFVTVIGDGAFSTCTALTSVIFGKSITSIGSYAFFGCSGLTSIAIPESVTSIGNSTFSSCSGLTSIAIPENVTSIGNSVFYNCSSLTSVIIPDSVTEIGNEAFNECSALTSLTIGNSVTSIGEWAFRACPGLTSITIPDAVKSIGGSAFSGCSGLRGVLKLPASIEYLGSCIPGTKYNVIQIDATTPPTVPSNLGRNIAMVIVPEGAGAAYKAADFWKDCTIVEEGSGDVEITVTEPGNMAIDIIEEYGIAPAKVTKLIVHGKIDQTDITVMKSNMLNCYSIDLSDADCEAIPDNAFSGKNYLIEMILPANCKSIGNKAFQNCTLEGIIFPETLESIGYYAFKDNAIAGDLMFPATVKTIGHHAFTGNQPTGADLSSCSGLAAIPEGLFKDITTLRTVLLPDGLKSIGNEAFYGCTGLTSDIIPNTVTTIGNSAFYGCTGLTSVTIPDQVTGIGNGAFQGCAGLRYIDLSKCSLLTSIQSRTFNGNSALEAINLPGSLTAIGSGAFAGCVKLQNISIAAKTPPTVAEASAFNNVDNEMCVLSIPTTSYTDYILAEHWGAFVSLCKGIAVTKDENLDIHWCFLPSTLAKSIVSRDIDSYSEDTPQVYGAIAHDGSSVYAKNNGRIRFMFDVADGYEVEQVLYNDADVTRDVANNSYITPAVTAKGKLVVRTAKIDVSGIEHIEVDGTDTDEDAPVRFFDLNGREITGTPAAGIYIRVQGTTATKVFVK